MNVFSKLDSLIDAVENALVKIKFITPEQQAANRKKAISSSNNSATLRSAKPTSPRSGNLEGVITRMASDTHLNHVSPKNPEHINQLHRKLADHKNGTNKLSSFEHRSVINQLTQHYRNAFKASE